MTWLQAWVKEQKDWSQWKIWILILSICPVSSNTSARINSITANARDLFSSNERGVQTCCLELRSYIWTARVITAVRLWNLSSSVALISYINTSKWIKRVYQATALMLSLPFQSLCHLLIVISLLPSLRTLRRWDFTRCYPVEELLLWKVSSVCQWSCKLVLFIYYFCIHSYFEVAFILCLEISF